jgi:hypothetical protein
MSGLPAKTYKLNSLDQARIGWFYSLTMHRPVVSAGATQSLETVTSAVGGNDRFGSENEKLPAVADVASIRVVAVTSAMRFIVRSFQSELDFQLSEPNSLFFMH